MTNDQQKLPATKAQIERSIAAQPSISNRPANWAKMSILRDAAEHKIAARLV